MMDVENPDIRAVEAAMEHEAKTDKDALETAKNIVAQIGPSLNGEFAAAQKKTVIYWYNELRPAIAAWEKERATNAAEVDQFNAGYEHAKSGGAYDPPSFYPNDQDTWGCGYAWYTWDVQSKQLAALRAAVEKASDDLKAGVTIESKWVLVIADALDAALGGGA